MYVSKVVDLTNHDKNIIYNMSFDEAVEVVRSGDVEAVRNIDGQFSLVSVEGKTIRMARSIGRPLRYFIAKRAVGPQLVIAEGRRYGRPISPFVYAYGTRPLYYQDRIVRLSRSKPSLY